MKVAVFGIGILLLAAAGCGSEPAAARGEDGAAGAGRAADARPTPPRCSVAVERSLTSARVSFAGFAPRGAVAYRTPGGAVLARFGRENVNGYPTYFAVLGKRVARRLPPRSGPACSCRSVRTVRSAGFAPPTSSSNTLTYGSRSTSPCGG